MKGHKEVRKIAFGYYVTITIPNFPSDYPFQLILPTLLAIFEEIGINPKGVQYNQLPSGVVFSVLVFPKYIERVYALFGSTPLIGVPLNEVAGLTPLEKLLPSGSDQPLVTYYVEPQIVVFFCSIPTYEQQLNILNLVSTIIGPVDVFELLGKILLISFQGSTGTSLLDSTVGVNRIPDLIFSKGKYKNKIHYF